MKSIFFLQCGAGHGGRCLDGMNCPLLAAQEVALNELPGCGIMAGLLTAVGISKILDGAPATLFAPTDEALMREAVRRRVTLPALLNNTELMNSITRSVSFLSPVSQVNNDVSTLASISICFDLIYLLNMVALLIMLLEYDNISYKSTSLYSFLVLSKPSGFFLVSRYHCLAVPLTLGTLARIPGQPLLTLLPGSFVAVAAQQLLSPAEAAGLVQSGGGGINSLSVEGQLNGASIILGNVQVLTSRRVESDATLDFLMKACCRRRA